LLLLAACGKTFTPDTLHSSGKIKVQILNNKLLTTDTDRNGNPFEFQVVELLKIFDLTSLSGKYARFYTNASNSEGKLAGNQPKAHFLKSKQGYFIPKDNFTMEIASLYFHTQNLAQLDEKVGAKDANSLPRKIIIGTKVNQISFQDNNAIYDGEMDAIIYLPYTETELTLALNGGIFAHEYFHSLFYKYVQIKLESNPFFKDDSNSDAAITNSASKKHTLSLAVPKFEKQKYLSDEDVLKKLSVTKMAKVTSISKQNIKDYYEFLFKSFNEGIADYWGWSYTLDTNFIKHSIPEVNSFRSLELKDHNLSTPVLFSRQNLLALTLQPFTSDSEKYTSINAYSYQAGTRVALFLKELTLVVSKQRNLSTEEAKIVVMKSIVNFLKTIGTNINTMDFNQSAESLISSQDLILEFAKSFAITNMTECQLFLTSYSSDLNNLNKLSCLKNNENYELTKVTELTNNAQ
jgi:hypothetical protein